jgi:DNA replicative helicase MCM subunit Mcm2 (Cdc46/Mcm family)
MAQVTVYQCDKCGHAGVDVKRVQLVVDGSRATFDLCQTCMDPITAILDLLAKAPVARPGRPSALIRTQTSKVYERPEDIPGVRSKN